MAKNRVFVPSLLLKFPGFATCNYGIASPRVDLLKVKNGNIGLDFILYDGYFVIERS